MGKDLEEFEMCPLLTVKAKDPQPCVKRKCAWYVELAGVDPQTGREIQGSKGCSIAMMPILQIETTQKMHQTAVATEGFRNRAKDINDTLHKIQPQIGG